jgi:2-oxo-4-hydroxy-4-carboxy--5-ureidoimidazoline (OHCU) decarboxylase
VLRLHPDLAGRLADEGRLTKDSLREQQSAGLHKLTPKEKAEINQLNARYDTGTQTLFYGGEKKSEISNYSNLGGGGG